jgi:osmotically-inducible protein OsmY
MTRNPLITLVAATIVMSTPVVVQSEDLGTKVSDEQITAQVKQKLAMDNPTVAPHILVTTHDGVVTLMGMQLHPQDILTAMHDAQSVDGVVRVENRMKPA